MTRVAANADWVLHVRDRESEWSRAVDEALTRHGLVVECHPDVYVALAALVRRRTGRCLAIFVGLDWLDGCEHRFPDVAARFIGAAPMWGYASHRPSATCAALASRRIRLIDDPGQLELIVSRIARSAGGGVAAKPAEPERSDVDESGPLPVPWMARPANPSRVPPPSQAPQAGPASDGRDPVLTPEELDALTTSDRLEWGES